MKAMIHQILTWIDRHSRRISWVLILLVFLAAGALGVAGGDQLRYPDERDYNWLAKSILGGNGYVDAGGRPTAYRPPGWPLILSGIYSLWDRPLAAKLFNALAHAGAAWLLAILAARITPRGRVFAPLLLLLYPLNLHAASTLYPQTVGSVLLLAILLLLDNRRRGVAAAAAAGVLFGLLVLAIPAFLLVVPLILAGSWITDRRRPALFAGRSAMLLLCAALVVAPWTLRNARVLGGFIPVSTNSGKNLLLGNSENTRPNSGVNVGLKHYRDEVRGMNEPETDARLRQLAVEWICNNPGTAAKLYVLKALNYFNFRNELFVKSEQNRRNEIIMFLSYYPLLALALLRLGLYRRYRISAAEAKLYLLYFGNAFASAVFFTRLRFRVPFDPLLIAIVAVFVGLLARAMVSGAGDRVEPTT